MSRSNPRAIAFTLGLLSLTLIAGCAPPDRWEVFRESLDHRVRAEQMREREERDDEASDPYQPHPTDEAAVELPVPADGEPMPLSIEQAVVLALRNNRDLRVQQLNPVVAGTFKDIERGVFDPEFFADFDFIKERASQTSRSTGEQFNVVGEDTAAIGGIRQRLPTGTDVELNVEQNRTTSDRAPEQQDARVGLTVTQSLLEGFGPAVNLARVRQAELDTVASVHQLRGFAEALLADVEIAYWNYVLAEQEIAIFEQSLQIAKEQRDQTEQRIAVGLLPETEAAAARAEVARREQALIDARSTLRQRRLQLLRLINPRQDDRLNVDIDTISEPAIDPQPITDLDDRLRLAQRRRPDLEEARVRLRQNRLETIVTRNGLLPQLDLFIALGKTGFDTTTAGSFRRINSKTYDATAGVRFSQLLGNRAAEARDRAARASRRQAARAVANLRQLARYEVRLAANEVERARKQITATAATRELQEEALEAERQRFDVGSSTALLVAQAQRDLLASQITEVEAVVNYRIALVELYLAEGSLLQRRGIQLTADDQG